MKSHRILILCTAVAAALHIAFVALSMLPTSASASVAQKSKGLEVQKNTNSAMPKPSAHITMRMQTKDDTPLRLSSNIDKGKEGHIASADKKKPQPKTKKPPKKVTPKKKSLKKSISSLSKKKKNTIKTKMDQSDYKRYLASQNISKVKGVKTPQINIAFKDVAEIMQVHRYYGLKLVAIDPTNPQSVVEVVGFGDNKTSFQKIENFNWSAFSNRVIERKAPYFKNLQNRMLKSGTTHNGMGLYSVAPNSADNYFRYKQIENISKAGVDIKNVKNVLARPLKTSFGGWIIEVTKLYMESGDVVDINDFELQDLK